jgi:methanogenic corrinoid protein MtbC1
MFCLLREQNFIDFTNYTKMITELLYQTYLNALLNSDRKTCFNIVEELLKDDIDIKTLYTDLFQRSLVDVGLLWERNKISVAKEHMATSLTQSTMQLVYPKLFTEEYTERTAVVSSATNEFHHVGARMVADVFEMHGWNCVYLGANTPDNDLITYIEEKKPDVVALSVSISFNLPLALEVVQEIKSRWADQAILLGGQAFMWGEQYIKFLQDLPSVDCILTLDNLEEYILNFDQAQINETG